MSKRRLLTLITIMSLLISHFTFWPFKRNTVKADPDIVTFYMRSDQHAVYSLTAYILNETQSATSTYVTDLYAASTEYTVKWSARVFLRAKDGTEQELTSGYTDVEVSRSTDGEGIQSDTWTCPYTKLEGHAIVIRIYIFIVSWTLKATFCTEPKAGAINGTWTFYLYTKRYTTVNPKTGQYTTQAYFYWGSSTYNSRVDMNLSLIAENIAYSWQNKAVFTSDWTVHIVLDGRWRYRYFGDDSWNINYFFGYEPAVDVFSNDSLVIVYKNGSGYLKWRMCNVSKSSSPWSWSLGDEKPLTSVAVQYFDVAVGYNDKVYVVYSLPNSSCYLAVYNGTAWNFHLLSFFDPNTKFSIGKYGNNIFIFGTNATENKPNYMKAAHWSGPSDYLYENATVSHVAVAGMGDFVFAEDGTCMIVYSNGSHMWTRKTTYTSDITNWETAVLIEEGNIKSPDMIQIICKTVYMWKVYYVSTIGHDQGDLICKWSTDGGTTWTKGEYALTWDNNTCEYPNIGKREFEGYYPFFVKSGDDVIFRYESVFYPAPLPTDNVHEPLSHAYGRKMFIALNRLWIFYTGDYKVKYTSCDLENLVWTKPVILETMPAATQDYSHGYFYYIYLENRSGTYYVHYTRCWEDTDVDNSVIYRRGTLHSNGTIDFTEPQVVIPANSSIIQYVTAVTTDSQGYPYIQWGKFDKTIYLVKSEFNNGTWSTETGWPKRLNTYAAGDYQFSGNIWPFGDGVYAIYQNGGLEPFGRWYNGTTLLPEENITDIKVFTTYGNYRFSASPDKDGNIHYVYCAHNQSVVYVKRTLSGWSSPEIIRDQGGLRLSIYAWDEIRVYDEANELYEIRKTAAGWKVHKPFDIVDITSDCVQTPVQPDTIHGVPPVAFVKTYTIIFRFSGLLPGYVKVPGPSYSNLGYTSRTQGSNSTFYCYWRSETKSDLDKWVFSWNATGNWTEEVYSFPEAITEAWSNITKTLPNQPITIAFYFAANDTLGNWGNTTIQILQLAMHLEVVVNDLVQFSSGVKLSLNRQVFESIIFDVSAFKAIKKVFGEYSNFTGLYWKGFVKCIDEFLSVSSSILKALSLSFLEQLVFQYVYAKSSHVVVDQHLSLSDFLSKSLTIQLSNKVNLFDKLSLQVFLLIKESILENLNFADALSKLMVKTPFENVKPTDRPSKTIVKVSFQPLGLTEALTEHLQILQTENLALPDQLNFNLYLLIREQIVDWLNIMDLPLKTVKVSRFGEFRLQDLAAKAIRMLQAETVVFFDEKFTSVFIIIKEQLIQDFVNIGDAIAKHLTTVRVEVIALPGAIIKHIAIFKTDSINFLDQITKRIGPFFYEKIIPEQVGFTDVVITYVWTPWYNNPVEFMKVILFGFCLGLFAYWIAKRL